MKKQRTLLFCYLLNTTSFSFSFSSFIIRLWYFREKSTRVALRDMAVCRVTARLDEFVECVESAVTDTPLHHSSAPTVTSKTCDVNHGELQSFVCQLRRCHSLASTSRPSGHSRCYGRTARVQWYSKISLLPAYMSYYSFLD
jgi:hypothetical protein